MTERCHDVAAYALGALPAGEARRFEEHLSGCVRCRDELSDLTGVVDMLPAAAAPVAPPAALREQIMITVNAEAELLSATGASADRVLPRRRIRIGRLSLRPVVALAVAAAVLIGIAGFAIGNATGPANRSAVTARVIPAVVARDLPAGAKASLALRAGAATLRVSGFPPAPAGREYQVWVVRGRGRSPTPTSALFLVPQDGSASVEVPGSIRGVRKLMVTAEPRGGSTTGVPSGAPVLKARLT